MLIMKNFGAILASRAARGALTVAETAAWPVVSSAEAAIEEKRILSESNGKRKSAMWPAPLGIGSWQLVIYKHEAVERDAEVKRSHMEYSS